jgi:PAT family beta-lactamase induction signal transducer AmpG
MGAFLVPSLLVICFSKDNRIVAEEHSALRFRFWIKENFIKAIAILFKRKKIIYIVFLLGFYKVSDAYVDTMLIPFLTQVGFYKVNIATAKMIGIITGILGTFVGVKIIHKVGMMWSLLSAEILAAITNLLFLFLIYFEKNKTLLYVINGAESFFGGIANIVLISYMSSMCNNKKFIASHYALLASFSIVFRVLLSSTSGWLVVEMGWLQFFIISALLSTPSLLCMYFIFFRNKKQIGVI